MKHLTQTLISALALAVTGAASADPKPETEPVKPTPTPAATTQPSTTEFTPSSLFRLQQAPMLGMLMAADAALLDVEWMFPVMSNITVGPTAFYWFDEEDRTDRLHTLNVGIRADYFRTGKADPILARRTRPTG